LASSSVEQSHRHGVAYIPLDDATVTTTLFMVWRRDNRSPLLDNFRAVVRSGKK
jgi:DNA-binding transcriptional LysR family regulator